MRTALSLALASLASLASGCIVYESDADYRDPYEPPPYVNYEPWVVDAESGVYWDNYYRDDIWYFEAAVDDGNGAWDVVAVWADVYDVARGDVYLESFELFPTDDPHIWFSDWLGRSTWLDPWYRGYVVDFVVYDSYECSSYVTVEPYVY